MNTNKFSISHLRPISFDYNNYTAENPVTVDPEVPVHSRVQRMVPSLREMCLSKIHPSRMPQSGIYRTAIQGRAIVDTPDECFANFLNNANKYNERNQPIGITQTEIDQLSPEWISSITENQMTLLNATFFNLLSQQQIDAFTPNQIAKIQLNEFKTLTITFLRSLNYWQIQAIARDQLTNIPAHTFRELCSHFTPIFIIHLSQEQLEYLTEEQIYAILEMPNVLFFDISLRLLYLLGQNQNQIAALPEQILRQLDVNILQATGGRFSHFILTHYRRYLNSEQIRIAEDNARCWQMVAGQNWTPAAITELSAKDLLQRLLALPSAAFVSLTREQWAVISPNVLNKLGKDFWNRILNDVSSIEIENLVSIWTREQVAAIPRETLLKLPLYRLSPEAIPVIPPDIFCRQSRIWPEKRWTLAQIATWTPEQVLTQLPDMFTRYPKTIMIYMLNCIFTLEVFNSVVLNGNEAAWTRYGRNLNRERIISIYSNTISRIRYPHFFGTFTQEQLRWLLPEQLAVIPNSMFQTWYDPYNYEDFARPVVLNTFLPSQIPYLNPNIFKRMSYIQLQLLHASQICSLTKEQLCNIPASTFEKMTEEALTRFYRNLTDEQRNNLTPKQRAVFRRILGEAAEVSTHNIDRQPPPPGGGSGPGGEGRGPGSSGGARPKNPNFIAKFYRWAQGENNGKKHAPFLPLEYIREAPPEFWNEYAGPKREIRTASYTAQGLPIVEVILTDLAEYQEWIRELKCDQIQSIPPAVISKLNVEVATAFSAKQILSMSPEQRKAFTVGFIDIEPKLKEILGITGNQILTINGKQISSNHPLLPEDYAALVDRLDGKQIQQHLNKDEIRNLANNPSSFLLWHLKPEHFFETGSHDWRASQIEALGKEIITQRWDAVYFNKLVPDQRKGILPYIAEIHPDVIANWEVQCFDSPGENPVIHGNYRNQIRKFTQQQIASIAPEVIAVLGVRFFRDYLSPQQVKMFRREQLQAISASTLSQLPANWFYHLMEEKEAGTWDTQRVSSLRENQVKAIPLTFFLKFGEKVGKRVALQFLEGLWGSQVQAISKEQLNALSAEDFSLLPADFLNNLNASQIHTRTSAQIAALGVLLLPAIRTDFIAYLTANQVQGWTPQQVSALRENQIRVLGNKISSLHPQIYRDVKAVNHLLLYGSIQQLKLLSKEQAQKADLNRISVKDFGLASTQKGAVFVNFFKEALIERQNSEYRKVIFNRVYAQLIREIHNGLTDEECQQLAVNMTVAQYRIGLNAFIDALETASVGMLTDGEQKAILLGTYRVRMAKDHSTETIVSALNRHEEPYSVETQVPMPPADTRIPGDHASNAQLQASNLIIN